MKRTVFIAAAAAVLLTAGPALADPVNWAFSGTWSDGGAVNGAFTYDADTNTYSGVSITTSGGALPSAVYISPQPALSGPSQLSVLTAGGPAAGQRVARFTFSGPLTNGGGTEMLGPASGEGTCDIGCGGFNGGVPNRTVATGVVTTAPPPIPTLGEWAMMGLAAALAGLGGLFVSRRRRWA